MTQSGTRIPLVNGGIHGLSNYSPEMTKSLEDELERIKKEYPVVRIEVNLSDNTHDNRWGRWKNNGNGKEGKMLTDYDDYDIEFSGNNGNGEGKISYDQDYVLGLLCRIT